MLEEVIERYLFDQAAKVGARSEKCVNLSRVGWPDRTVQWPEIGIDLVELKKPGQKPEPHQTRVHEYLAGCGVPVYVLDSKDAVDAYIICRMRGIPIPGYMSVPIPARFYRDPTDPHE